jgi:hypothetical protein
VKLEKTGVAESLETGTSASMERTNFIGTPSREMRYPLSALSNSAIRQNLPAEEEIRGKGQQPEGILPSSGKPERTKDDGGTLRKKRETIQSRKVTYDGDGHSPDRI